MSCPLAYPAATSRPRRDVYGQAGFSATRPGTEVHFCTSSFIRAGGGRR
jgi:hypothetical protein